MRLLNDVVAAREGNHLLVVTLDQVRALPDRGSIAPQLVGTDRVWDIVFAEESGQEDLRSFSISVALEQGVEHETVLVDCPREPVSDAIHRRANFVQKPAETPASPPAGRVHR